jgi:hypothetical protein
VVNSVVAADLCLLATVLGGGGVSVDDHMTALVAIEKLRATEGYKGVLKTAFCGEAVAELDDVGSVSNLLGRE